jgi:uncharacterized SAM-binding protein YcdF (DUF218 family)
LVARATTLLAPDVIVVLGCRIGLGGEPGPAAARRIDRAARAFFELGPRAVIASGGRRWEAGSSVDGGTTTVERNTVAEADAFAAALVRRGVDRDTVIRELCSLSTIENAWYSAELLREGGFERPAVVTCDWHMTRAIACFARVGVRALALPAPTEPLSVVKTAARHFHERAHWIVDRIAATHWIRE